MKYVVITGGVLSGLGKGITASSIGLLLKRSGLSVTSIKIDPYLNCDAGTMSPYQHGEVFVLDDGGEVDLDLGNYERFLDTHLGSDHNITTGKVYKAVIEKERKGDYLGKTVQIIPHITNEIKDQIKKVGRDKKADVTLIEMGGTVGDIESMPFLEAVRQLHSEVGERNVLFVHTTLVPVVGVVGEQKTKPTQHSVKELRSIGIAPDLIVCRSQYPLEKDVKGKIALFCDVPVDNIISCYDVENVYQVPLLFHKQKVPHNILKQLGYRGKKPNLNTWRKFVKRTSNPKHEVTIALVGKYTHLKDSYISYSKAFVHAGEKTEARVNIKWIEAEDLDAARDNRMLKGVNGICVAGGFGIRGAEGKIRAAKFARTNNVPFLGVCLGFQMAVVEYARNVCKLSEAHSTEFVKKTPQPVIDLLPEMEGVTDMGGTMRLGGYTVHIKKGSMAHSLYGRLTIRERHRHRFEVNPEFIPILEKGGMKFTGKDDDGIRMEIAEIDGHPYYMATQFHPEFLSHPLNPSPPYLGLVKAAVEHARSNP